MFTKNSKIAAVIAALVVVGGGSSYAALSLHGNGGAKPQKSVKAATNKPKSNGLDLEAIKSGDFSCVAGTWKNPGGDTYVFDDHGLKEAIFDGRKITDAEILLKGEGTVGAASIKEGMLQASLGNKNHSANKAETVAPFYFIPKGVNLPGTSNPNVDRLYCGQALGDDNVFTKTIESKQTKEMENLPLKTKQALALLGLPEHFQSDYGETTPDMLLKGQAKPVRKVNGQDQTYDVKFRGMRLFPEREKYVLELQNLPDDVYNQTSQRGVIYLDGDTIVYKNETVLGQGKGKDESVQDQTTGKKSLYDLYKQYKGTKRLKEMEKLIIED
ncbi:hypothetical protein G6R29_05145 [Fructobacillus sp. M2-14]|uniref:DUF6287 domain-containing protein n=1 Tax=Fructobacillus broussonetiae TaxID=2713173 RepID=A0ABS5R229_9LACO|nr:DUF6287 domain-containing protein [Fructobacillus broussonetiae]MBS9339005.1 hypothetical protein [Fructobacillus broussonetiae]